MKRVLLTGLAGLLLLAVFILARLPAQYVLSQLPPAVEMSGVQGTVWQGEAALLSIQGHTLGTVTWEWQPAALLRAQWGYRMTLSGEALNGEFTALVGAGQQLTLATMTLTAQASYLSSFSSRQHFMPLGRLDVSSPHMLLLQGWPVEGSATLTWHHAALGGELPMVLGDLVADVDVAGDQLQAEVADKGGPLELSGSAALNKNYTYTVDLRLRARAEADDNLRTSVSLIGAPDPTGRYHLNLEGVL